MQNYCCSTPYSTNKYFSSDSIHRCIDRDCGHVATWHLLNDFIFTIICDRTVSADLDARLPDTTPSLTSCNRYITEVVGECPQYGRVHVPGFQDSWLTTAIIFFKSPRCTDLYHHAALLYVSFRRDFPYCRYTSALCILGTSYTTLVNDVYRSPWIRTRWVRLFTSSTDITNKVLDAVIDLPFGHSGHTTPWRRIDTSR